MDKQQARNLIKATFEEPFDKDRFISFVKNLLNRIEEDYISQRQGQYIPDAYKPFISTFERIGKFNDGENRIDILIIKLQKETSLEHARSSQRNFVAGYLQGKYGSSNEKDAALVAFISPDESDWRFSLVKMDYKFEQTKTGIMKAKGEFTPARRWSFLVGANENSHTAQSHLVNILADDEKSPTLADLEEAFNIETVTKEFFLKYRDLFIRTIEALEKLVKSEAKIKADFAAKGVNAVDFAKKLLGQIIFLYFLQKKGWFGVNRDAKWGSGSKQFLRELLEEKHGNYKNFFNDILEPLFYEALRIDRSYDDGYYSRFNCKIPFLNGGLFDPIGDYDWVHTDICLPDSLFSNKDKTKEGDIADGILDIFDRYNFTVREDEPLEKEVAIDPELLGKAYEKFNAIRPDNFEAYKEALKSGKKGEESKFNKQYGVYYTPREIVHYMCQQSLINYLFTELNSGKISYEKLGNGNLDMFGNEGNKGQLDITIEHSEYSAVAKEDIEILIHLGEQISENETTALMKEQRITAGKQRSTKIKPLLPESIRKNAALIDQKLAEIAVCDPAVGSGAFPVGMMNEIVKVRNVLTIFIANNQTRTPYNFKRQCIEHSLYGVDIDPGAVEIAKLRLWLSLVVDEDDIKNIKPLPNLDYKVVCGNSLLGVEKNLFNNQLFAELEKIKPLYFSETNPTKKQEYKKQIDELISRITNGHKVFDFEVYFSEVFHNKCGFDVVIGNPPYIPIESMTEKEKTIYKTNYSELSRKYDSAAVFILKGRKLLCNTGYLIYISSITWQTGENYSLLRQTLFTKSGVKLIVNLPFDVFKAAYVDTGIYMVSASKSSNYKIYCFPKTATEFKLESLNYQIVPTTLVEPPDYKIILNFFASKLLHKIKSRTDVLMLGDISISTQGLAGNAFKLKTTKSSKTDFNYLVDGQVYRYVIEKNTIGYTAMKDKPSLMKFYESGEKILVRRVINRQNRLMATLLDEQLVFKKDVNPFLIIDKRVSPRFVLGILNSTLISYLYLQTSSIATKDDFRQTTLAELRRIPILIAAEARQDSLIILVDHILTVKRAIPQADPSELEREIDRMVYELYGLTEEEIKIVEGN